MFLATISPDTRERFFNFDFLAEIFDVKLRWYPPKNRQKTKIDIKPETKK